MRKVFIGIFTVFVMLTLGACTNYDVVEKDEEETIVQETTPDDIPVPKLLGVNTTNSLDAIEEIEIDDELLSFESVRLLSSSVLFDYNHDDNELFESKLVTKNGQTVYIQMNEPIWIVAHILQPEDRQYVILSVTMNGVQYQIGSRAWQNGDTVGVSFDASKVWIPLDPTKDLTGTYTIDTVKYVDGTFIKDVDKDPENPDFIELYIGKTEPRLILENGNEFTGRLEYDKETGVVILPTNVDNPFGLNITGYNVTGYGVLPANGKQIQLPGETFPEFVELSISYEDGDFSLQSRKYYSPIFIRTGEQLANLDREVTGDIMLFGTITIDPETWTPLRGKLVNLIGERFEVPVQLHEYIDATILGTFPYPPTTIVNPGDETLLLATGEYGSWFSRINFVGQFEIRNAYELVFYISHASSPSKVILRTRTITYIMYPDSNVVLLSSVESVQWNAYMG